MTTPVDNDGLEVRDLTVEYRSAAHVVRALDTMNLRVRPGELVVLLGPSGSGKTTLLSCVGGLLRPTSGSIRLAGTQVTELSSRGIDRHRREEVGFVFQAFNLIASLSARENVAAPAMLTGLKRRAALQRADELLEQFGLTQRAHHRPGELSGGEQQRVAIARGLVRRPRLLLADEPTANLDRGQAGIVMELLLGLRDHRRMVVVSTHDTSLAEIADRVIDMSAARSTGPEEIGNIQAGDCCRDSVAGVAHVGSATVMAVQAPDS